jgi:hypothetical protein
VVHHRARGIGQDRGVQIREEAGVAPERWRQDSEIVHRASQSSAAAGSQVCSRAARYESRIRFVGSKIESQPVPCICVTSD